MKHSLARRIFRTIFAVGAINALITMVAIEYIYEDVEETILRLEIAAERSFLETRIEESREHSWSSALTIAQYVPDGQTPENLHPLFQNRSIPFSAEVHDGDETYLVSVERTESPPGVLYISREITLLEDREDTMQIGIAILCLGMLLLGLLLARQGTQRVVRPLRSLTDEIARITPGTQINRIEPQYEEVELAAIASTLNGLLSDLDDYVKREKALVSVASHELRTPVAVIAGALDVLEQRNSLGEADRRTVRRIRRATDEMRSDVDALLKLARRTTHDDVHDTVDLVQCIEEVINDIGAVSPEDEQRITCISAPDHHSPQADPVLVRMLLRNLIQNAVRHTRGPIQVRLTSSGMTIQDHGDGMPLQVAERLTSASGFQVIPENGLGLFIVRLICERLGWHIDTPRSGSSGTAITLHFRKSATPALPL